MVKHSSREKKVTLQVNRLAARMKLAKLNVGLSVHYVGVRFHRKEKFGVTCSIWISESKVLLFLQEKN